MYRRTLGDHYWHFSPSCSSWPDRSRSVRLPEDEYPEKICPSCEKIMLGRMLLLGSLME